MSKNTYIVKSTEEEIGEEYFKVTVPEGTLEKDVKANFTMASKYASVCFDCDEEKEDYDEHFDEMVEVKEETNGQETFNYYLENFCGYKVEPVTYDFEYEW